MRIRLVIFISIVQAILLLTHWFVYATCSYLWGGWASSWEMKLVFAALSVSFVLASLRGWYSFSPLVRIFYTAAAVWLGIASFFFWASIVSWIVVAIGKIAGLGWPQAVIADVAFSIGFAAAMYGMINAARLRVVPVTITLPDLPPQWRGRKAVLVSDLHLGHVRNYRFVSRVVDRILSIAPDLVLIAGDLYDGMAGDFEKLSLPWKDLVASQAAGHGVYYIAGNHEEFYAHAEYLPALLRAGVRVLNNEKVEVDGLQIAGVHYRDAATEHYHVVLRRLGLDRNRASILLLHAPVQLPLNEREGVSLQLSGHTHGGQFFPWTLIGRRVWGKFNHGLQRLGNMQVLVTYGAGTWGPPLRVGTQPEIVLITFR